MLWVRALLNSAGELDDGVAMELLPPSSRWLVGEALAPLWAPAMEKLGWIAQRTAFIDEAVDAFLASGDGEAQVVLLGSGYDTRALRYAGRGAKFFEVDLPNVVEAKRKMSAGYCAARGVAPAPALAADLNEAAGDVLARLEGAGVGFDRAARTLVVSEAVLFYLSPPAKAKLLAECAALVDGVDGSALVLADNLAPYVRGPARAAADAYFGDLGLELRRHDTLWGGAIQFVDAASKAA